MKYLVFFLVLAIIVVVGSYGLYYFQNRETHNITKLVSYKSELPFCNEKEELALLSKGQHIGLLKITPEIITANESTEVTITAEIGDSPMLIPMSVELLRFSSNTSDKLLGSYGVMEKSSSIPEKGIYQYEKLFFSKIVLNESVPSGFPAIVFGVTAEYRGLNCKLLSHLLGGYSYLGILPKGNSPEQMFEQLADALEKGDFATAQTYFTSSKQNRHILDGLGEKEAKELASELRDVVFKEEVNATYRLYTGKLKSQDGSLQDYEITVVHSGNGNWLISSF